MTTGGCFPFALFPSPRPSVPIMRTSISARRRRRSWIKSSVLANTMPVYGRQELTELVSAPLGLDCVNVKREPLGRSKNRAARRMAN